MRDELARWLPTAPARLEGLELQPRLQQVGRLEKVGDGVAVVSGLPETRLDELIVFANGARGLAVSLDATTFGCFLLGAQAGLCAGSEVHGTGEVARVPVGPGLLGRVVDPLGTPVDGGPPLEAARWDPVDRAAPPIVDRDLVSQPLHSGLLVVDSLVPLGKGQRELIVGDRKTGKTAIAVDTIVNQRDTEVICVYAAIGQRESSVARVIDALQEHAEFSRCVVVVGEASAPPGAQWLTPYAACTMAEFFRDQGQDVLLVFDDLTKHADVHRQLSLLLRNPPGREAYPGDVFYLHGRLLERSAKLSQERGGGSLTALPIAETQAGNLTAYIPTNLISITDGQIYLEPKLFYEGHKPAVDVGKSVSRVGGKTQSPAMRSVADALKLEYSQFLELETFTRFGGLSDERTRKTIEHGRRIRAVFRQRQLEPLRLSEQVALLLALQERLLDDVPLEEVHAFQERLRARLPGRCERVLKKVDETLALDDDDRARLLRALRELLSEPDPAPPETGPA
ncbi:MAG: F0F1 ATP synthase subunit alpha [Planctomycetes bacterium]|nr:F0F1 ATP synthase subunit alpha [Planctomycetota bacterium]